MTLRFVCLASGRGSNFQAIMQNIESGSLDAKCELLLSNRKTAAVLETARNFSVEACYLENQEDLLEKLSSYNFDLIVLAGYMKILSTDFVQAYAGRIINIHPSLLPAFPGLKAQKQALNYGCKISGCTVHFVDEGCDTGPIIAQEAVKIFADDDEDSLSSRILEKEHILYSKVLKAFANQEILLDES